MDFFPQVLKPKLKSANFARSIPTELINDDKPNLPTCLPTASAFHFLNTEVQQKKPTKPISPLKSKENQLIKTDKTINVIEKEKPTTEPTQTLHSTESLKRKIDDVPTDNNTDFIKENISKKPKWNSNSNEMKNRNWDNNYRRINMKVSNFKKGGGGKFASSRFLSKGAKFKRFQWKNKKFTRRAGYNGASNPEADDDNFNANMVFNEENLIQQKAQENDDGENLIFHTKKSKQLLKNKNKPAAETDKLKNENDELSEKKENVATPKARKSRKKVVEKDESENKADVIEEKVDDVENKSLVKTKKRASKKAKNDEALESDDKPKKSKKRPKKAAKVVDEDEDLILKLSYSDEENKAETKTPKSKKKPKINDSIDMEELQEIENIESELAELNSIDTDGKMRVFHLNSEDNSLPKLADNYLESILYKYFGHKKFKEHQKEAIIRVCCGLPTLVIFSTGYGKSLIYQFATKMFSIKYKSCLTLVISPLISLMQDQLNNLPKSIKGAFYDTQMNAAAFEKLSEDIQNGQVHLLFVSPEALILSRNLKQILHSTKISFVCIDEIHCLSQWSHNFRPSYLQICNTLKYDYKIECVLGLTATATQKTINDLKGYLDFRDENILKNTDLPENLTLSVSQDINKERALVELIKKNFYLKTKENSAKICLNNIIIYCTRREQCERLATLLRMSIASNSDDKIQIAEAYHAGLTPSQRTKIQKAFLKGKLRMIVATLAFGMGINMPNIRAIVHFNMPKSIENYVQEIGRAGRDGQPARCHLFLDSNNDTELNEIKKYLFMNDYDKILIKKFLCKIFCPCEAKCDEMLFNGLSEDDRRNLVFNKDFFHENRMQYKHQHLVSIDYLVNFLDIKEESIETLICYLENEMNLKLVSSNCFAFCRLRCYSSISSVLGKGETRMIRALLETCKKIGGANWIDEQEFEIDMNAFLMACGGMSYFEVVNELKQFEYINRKALKIELETKAFYLRHACLSYRDGDDNMDVLFEKLWSRQESQVNFGKKNFIYLYNLLHSNSYNDIFELFGKNVYIDDESNVNEDMKEKSDRLKNAFNDYFGNKFDLNSVVIDFDANKTGGLNNEKNVAKLTQSIKKFIAMYEKELTINGRLIANIFHGISTPKCPADVWGRNKLFWRAHLDFDYEFIMKTASKQLVSF